MNPSRPRLRKSGQVAVSHLILLAAVALATTGGMKTMGRGMGRAIAGDSGGRGGAAMDAEGSSKDIGEYDGRSARALGGVIVSREAATSMEALSAAVLRANKIGAEILADAARPVTRLPSGALSTTAMRRIAARIATAHPFEVSDVTDVLAYLQGLEKKEKELASVARPGAPLIRRSAAHDSEAAEMMANALDAHGAHDAANALHAWVDATDFRRVQEMDLFALPGRKDYLIQRGAARPGEINGRFANLETYLDSAAADAETIAAWLKAGGQGVARPGRSTMAKHGGWGAETARRFNALAAQGELPEEVAAKVNATVASFRARLAAVAGDVESGVEAMLAKDPKEWRGVDEAAAASRSLAH